MTPKTPPPPPPPTHTQAHTQMGGILGGNGRQTHKFNLTQPTKENACRQKLVGTRASIRSKR